jgi:hypothetical protein
MRPATTDTSHTLGLSFDPAANILFAVFFVCWGRRVFGVDAEKV